MTATSSYLNRPLRTVEEVLYERAMKVAGTPSPAMQRLLLKKQCQLVQAPVNWSAQ